MDVDEIKELQSCNKCGVVLNMYLSEISRKETDWYGTTITFKCPVCETEDTHNLGNGYYK